MDIHVSEGFFELLNGFHRNFKVLTGHKIRSKILTFKRFEQRFALQRPKCTRQILCEYIISLFYQRLLNWFY
jgi:hypothetical protein